MFVQGSEFYYNFLAAIIICYIIFKLNADVIKKAAILNYCISCLVITACTFLKGYLFPELNWLISMLVDLLTIVLVVYTLHQPCAYHSALTAFMTILLMGAADILAALVYIYPLKLTISQFKSSFFHVSAGRLIMFLFIYFMLKLLADSFIKCRRRLLKKYDKLLLILSANLIAALTMLLYIYSLFSYYLDYRSAGHEAKTAYFSIGIITVMLIVSIAGTLYIINYLILNRLKYDRLKNNHAMDSMTNTLNRGTGLRFMEEQLELCKKLDRELAICFIDINDLKIVNDMHGHRKGDELIKLIVETIRECIRETDAICRLGGDEFVVVFPSCTIQQGQLVMERVAGKLKDLVLLPDEEYIVSFSYGFSEYDGNLELTVDGLIDRADQQMYTNKRAIKALTRNTGF